MINENSTPRSQEADTSVVGLVEQLVHEVPALFTKELALAKAELGESLRTTEAGVAAGAIVLLAGFIVLLMGVVYFLSLYLTPWAAALLVGAVVMVIGFIMLQSGKKRDGDTAQPLKSCSGRSGMTPGRLNNLGPAFPQAGPGAGHFADAVLRRPR